MIMAGNKLKKREPISRIGIGPMSPEIVEAAFRYSSLRRTPLMLIASKNQIDWDGGYVGGWKTTDYMDYVKKMKKKYPRAEIYVCRDHCGPGFKNDDLDDVYKTIDSDIENGFDLIHVDFCHAGKDKAHLLEQSRKVI